MPPEASYFMVIAPEMPSFAPPVPGQRARIAGAASMPRLLAVLDAEVSDGARNLRPPTLV